MSLLRLSNAQMVQFANELLAPESAGHRAIIEVPTAAPYLPVLAGVRTRLHGSQATPTDPRYVQLTEVCNGLDATHDDYVRAIDWIFSGFAILAGDPASRAQIERLHALLLPTGAEVVNASWLAEAGEADLREKRLGPAEKKLLEKLPVPGGKMSGVIDTLNTTAALLGTKVNERNALETGDNAGERHAARNAWVRAINGLDRALADGGVSKARRREILGTIREAEAIADRNAAARPPKAPKGTTAPTAKKSKKGAVVAAPDAPAIAGADGK